MKKITILHYHLHPGGVTSVIRSQIKSLKMSRPDVPITILCGDCPDPNSYRELGADVVVDEMLNYLTRLDDSPDVTLKSMLFFLKQQTKKDEILHVHNPNLGKNPILTLALSRLAAEGYPLVYHIHDFAEDRPANHAFLKAIIGDRFGESLREVMYPKPGRVLFATLNSFDARRLKTIGVPPQRVRVLPNPLEAVDSDELPPKAQVVERIGDLLGLDLRKKIITYPVRVIRRKNIGEFILLAVLFEREANWLVTLPPQNPIEKEPYLKWKQFCKSQGINIHFEVGTDIEFKELMTASDFCITTSLREGFGMAFLEPWTFGTPVIGRNLPTVTRDFIDKGLVFPQLYDALLLPDMNGALVDFKDLDMSRQMEVIGKVKQSAKTKTEIFARNPFLENFLQDIPPAVIERNRAIIRREYSLEKYGKRLNEIYQDILGASGKAGSHSDRPGALFSF